jgi:hypothetical protein
MNDAAVVEIQLGRPPRSAVEVVARCHLGVPVVISVPPLLDDGTPFPTRHWLTCPLAVRRIGRIESSGGVRSAEALIAGDESIAVRHRRAMEAYAAGRDALLPDGHEGPRPTGGVGGARAGVKCLHAHYAHTAAGGDNPIGEWVRPEVEPLDCRVPCVAEAEEGVAWNPAWSEPKR